MGLWYLSHTPPQRMWGLAFIHHCKCVCVKSVAGERAGSFVCLQYYTASFCIGPKGMREGAGGMGQDSNL